MKFPDYKIVNEKTTGYVIINEDSQYNNMDAVCVVIEKNVTARIFGQIKDKIILKRGSKLFLHGNNLGQVENTGGEIHMYEH